MRLIRGVTHVKKSHVPCVATIGAFDGMHLGHQAVLQQVKDAAAQRGVASAVILFEPQPKEYFAPHLATPRLMQLRDKVAFLQSFGIDWVVCLRFNATLAALSAEDFVQQVLVNGLQVRHVIIGDDFRFGKGRQGDFALLEKMGTQHGYSVKDTQTLLLANKRTSSSRVRDAVLKADFGLAEHLLGRDYTLQGRVQHGQKLGRTLGFPTINLRLKHNMVVNGIYAVTVSGLTDQPLYGAASVGTRPAVQGQSRLLEVYCFDYTGDAYGKCVEVAFHHKVRDEQDFASLEDLTTAMQQDVASINDFFHLEKST